MLNSYRAPSAVCPRPGRTIPCSFRVSAVITPSWPSRGRAGCGRPRPRLAGRSCSSFSAVNVADAEEASMRSTSSGGRDPWGSRRRTDPLVLVPSTGGWRERLRPEAGAESVQTVGAGQKAWREPNHPERHDVLMGYEGLLASRPGAQGQWTRRGRRREFLSWGHAAGLVQCDLAPRAPRSNEKRDPPGAKHTVSEMDGAGMGGPLRRTPRGASRRQYPLFTIGIRLRATGGWVVFWAMTAQVRDGLLRRIADQGVQVGAAPKPFHFLNPEA